jgi:hypothetical protein
MAFGKHEYYNENYIEYKESVDMLLRDIKLLGYEDLTKEKLNDILVAEMSIGRAVREELERILNRG